MLKKNDDLGNELTKKKQRRRRPGRGPRDESGSHHNVKLSKALSWLLRHNLVSEGFEVRPDGFVPVSQVLLHKRFKGYEFGQIEEVVKQNDKQRFALKEDPDDPGQWLIRANQGHSHAVAAHIDDHELLTPVLDADTLPLCVHGTTLRAWTLIKNSGGLSRMGRAHVHFATALPKKDQTVESAKPATSFFTSFFKEPQASKTPEAVSGIRSTSEVLIYLDVGRALASGIKLFLSANGVVLSSGDPDRGHIIPISIFSTVIVRQTGQILFRNPLSFLKAGNQEAESQDLHGKDTSGEPAPL